MSVYVQAGSEGEWVRKLQRALNEAGYELDVDGIFGDATDEAVRDFQNENDLDVDGVVGPNTWAALGIDVPASRSKNRRADTVYLESGSRGDAVAVLQSALVAAGYELDVDGIFGSATYEAVREFQNDNDLDVDGVVGPNTWAALEEYIEGE
jgi:peptidoglycan hydrolase-like protein with peptidoglycan-binding domain